MLMTVQSLKDGFSMLKRGQDRHASIQGLRSRYITDQRGKPGEIQSNTGIKNKYASHSMMCIGKGTNLSIAHQSSSSSFSSSVFC
jgi:hypothetical protein